MGNCLKRATGNQQDNTTLLSNNPEPNVSTSGSSQEGLGPPIPYNVIHVHHRYCLIVVAAVSSLLSVLSYPKYFIIFECI